jgi:hypothetical protein
MIPNQLGDKMTQLTDLQPGSRVTIHSGGTSHQIAEGVVIARNAHWAVVKSSYYMRPAHFRVSGPLAGVRIVGCLAEHLNERIRAV